jgi:prepilin-type N-terminal cleavage/methylation domain-containing protein
MKRAFTLAEVLITLGIIGVVAAMTLPTLIQNYKKQVTATRLKKAYNTMSNAIRLSENANGPMATWPQQGELNGNDLWNVYFSPYLNGARLCQNMQSCGYKSNSYVNTTWTGEDNWGLHSSSTRILFQFKDGIVVFFPLSTTNSAGNPLYQDILFIDINGSQLPNEAGRDVFLFIRDNTNGRITAPKGNCKTTRRYCTYEIMSNGWRVPDDYPYKL